VSDNEVRLTERSIVGSLRVRHHEEHVGESGAACLALSFDESSRVGVEPDHPPGSRGKMESEVSGAGPDVDDGTTLKWLLI